MPLPVLACSIESSGISLGANSGNNSDGFNAMLDPNLCVNKPIVNVWTAVSWQVFNYLITPALVVPVLLAVTILPWSIRRFRWKRQISAVGGALLLIYLVALTPKASALGNRVLVSFLPADPGSRVDAIVVLGRGPDLRPARVDVAADLWHENRAPLIFASGTGDAEEIADLLKARGVPEASLDGEPCSRTTEENARFTAAILPPKQFRQILLVTDSPHMLRSFLTFRSLGFTVIPHPNPLPPDLDGKNKAFLVFREYLGIVGYGLRGRFLHREPSPNDRAEIPVTKDASRLAAPAAIGVDQI